MIAKKKPYIIKQYPNRKSRTRIIRTPRHVMKQDEENAAELLCRIGGSVTFLPERHIPGMKNPDCEWGGKVWEIKTLYGKEGGTTKEAMRKARKQSENIIISLLKTSRDIYKVADDVIHYFRTEATSSSIRTVIILAKNNYCILERSMVR